MAWPDITEYTADEKVAAATELTELSSLIDARTTKILNVRGKLTDEEEELQRMKDVIQARISVLSAE
jgi:hypothetical protein